MEGRCNTVVYRQRVDKRVRLDESKTTRLEESRKRETENSWIDLGGPLSQEIQK